MLVFWDAKFVFSHIITGYRCFLFVIIRNIFPPVRLEAVRESDPYWKGNFFFHSDNRPNSYAHLSKPKLYALQLVFWLTHLRCGDIRADGRCHSLWTATFDPCHRILNLNILLETKVSMYTTNKAVNCEIIVSFIDMSFGSMFTFITNNDIENHL